jgi:hypothetical protein
MAFFAGLVDLVKYINSGQLMYLPPGENDKAGLNVTVWEGGRSVKEGLNVTWKLYLTVWEEGWSQTDGKNVAEGAFCHNLSKKGGLFATATSRPPPRLGGCKIPGHSVWSRNITGDVVNPSMLRWADVLWGKTLLGRPERGSFVKAPAT